MSAQKFWITAKDVSIKITPDESGTSFAGIDVIDKKNNVHTFNNAAHYVESSDLNGKALSKNKKQMISILKSALEDFLEGKAHIAERAKLKPEQLSTTQMVFNKLSAA